MSEIQIDKMERYRSIVANIELPQNKKDELIIQVYRMMRAFVDAAFGDDSVQYIIDKPLKDSFQTSASPANVSSISFVDRHGITRAEIVDPDDVQKSWEARIVPPNHEENAP